MIAYSSGNHAQAVAASARLAGTTATVLMPATAPALKVARCRAFGATVILHDGDRYSMVARADEIAEAEGRILVPPFDDPLVIAGQGTVGLEIAEDLAAADIVPDAVLVPCGGGGLTKLLCSQGMAALGVDVDVSAMAARGLRAVESSTEESDDDGGGDGDGEAVVLGPRCLAAAAPAL